MQVSPFSFPPAFIGVGYGIPSPGMGPIKTDPKKEYVAGGYGFLQRNIPQVLPWMVDDVTRDYGPEVYDAMDTDGVVGGTFRLLKFQILANEIQILPALRPAEDRAGDPSRNGWSPKELLAQEIADFCMRNQCRQETPIKTVFSEMLDSLREGNKIAERLYEPGRGIDAERIVRKDMKTKPRWAFLWVADVFLSTVGILAFDPEEGGFIIVPRDKFFACTWQQRNHDPRGTSLYRGGYRAWNFKQLLYPDYYAHTKQFASPTISGNTAPETEMTSYPAVDDRGNAIPNAAPVTAEEAMKQALIAWRNGGVVVNPFGAIVKVEWPQGDGAAFLKCFDFLDHQIVYSILGSVRDSLEAKHGSRADGEVSQDKTGNLIRMGREMLEQAYRRDVLYQEVLMNWGQDVADELTPIPSLGAVEHQDVVALMGGVAKLLTAGGIDKRSQLPAIHAMLDLPPAAPGAFDDAENEPAKPGDPKPDDDDGKDDADKEERQAA